MPTSTRTEQRYFLVANNEGVRGHRTYSRAVARRAIRLFRFLGNEQAYFHVTTVVVA